MASTVRAGTVAMKSATARSTVQKLGIAGVRRIIAVASCKGGVGKSTTAVNLAISLKNLGLVSGILDADLHGPSVHRMMCLHEVDELDTTDDGRIVPPQNYGVKAMSLGLLLGEDNSLIARGPMVSQQMQNLLKAIEWGDLDILVIDMPPGTHDIHITVSQHLSMDGAVIVTTPQDIATMDTRRGMHMFRSVQIPMLGLVENMAYFVCDNCDKRHHIFGTEGTARAAADAFGVPFLGSLPLDVRAREGMDVGEPVCHLGEHGHPLAPAYYKLARQVVAALDEQNPRDQTLTITIEEEEEDNINEDLDEDLTAFDDLVKPGTNFSSA